MEADFVPGEGACKCSEGNCKHTPMERNGWEVQGVGVVRPSVLDWKAAAADRGEGPFRSPRGFLSLSYIDTLLFCGIHLNDFGGTTL